MAKAIVAELKAKGITQAHLDGNDEIMDILQLTCIEAGISLSSSPDKVVLRFVEQEYKIVYSDLFMKKLGESK